MRSQLVFGAIVCALVLGSSVFAQEISSATWVPGTGPAVPLVDGGPPVVIDSAISKGKVVVEGAYPLEVHSVVIACALSYGDKNKNKDKPDDQQVFYEAGTTRFFELGQEYIRLTADHGATRVQAIIPMINTLFFHPNLHDETQTLFVWMGRPGTIAVDPVNGVSAPDDAASYPVDTVLPARSIIPDDESHIYGIQHAKTLRLAVFRSEKLNSDEEYQLTFAGDPGALEAMDLPPTATIPKNEFVGAFTVSSDPLRTNRWPQNPFNITVTATSTLGSVSSNLFFPGALVQVLGAGFVPPPAGLEACDEHTSIPAQAAATDCGECVSVTVPAAEKPCPNDWATGDHILTYNKYKCIFSVIPACTIVNATFMHTSTTVTVFNQACTPAPAIGEVIAPAGRHFRARRGHQCCYRRVVNALPECWMLPDCM